MIGSGLGLLELKERDEAASDIGFRCYRDYLKSNLWKSIRGRVFSSKGGGCSVCRKKSDVVHHEFYTVSILKGDSIDSLWPLCDGCHEAIHKPKGKFVGLAESSLILRRKMGVVIPNKKRRKKADTRTGFCMDCGLKSRRDRCSRCRKAFRVKYRLQE